MRAPCLSLLMVAGMSACGYSTAASSASAAAAVQFQLAEPALISIGMVITEVVSISTGILTMRIPSATSLGMPSESAGTMQLTATGTSRGYTVFTSTDVPAISQLITQLGASGGTVTTTGVLNGQSVQVMIVGAAQVGAQSGNVTAVITFD